jgi:cell division protein FtsB
MGAKQHLLRKQVKAEVKIRRYIAFTLLLLSLIYVTGSFVFGDTGFLRYFDLKKKQSELEQELNTIMDETFRLETTIKVLKEDDFYVEKHAREDFGLAGPDEYIFIYKK